LRIGCNRPNFEVLAYGKGVVVERTEHTKIVEFDINKVLNPAHLCLIVGPFSKVSIPLNKQRNKSLSSGPKLVKANSKLDAMAEESRQIVELYFMG